MKLDSDSCTTTSSVNNMNELKDCKKCEGKGYIIHHPFQAGGNAHAANCPHCKGTGKIF